MGDFTYDPQTYQEEEEFRRDPVGFAKTKVLQAVEHDETVKGLYASFEANVDNFHSEDFWILLSYFALAHAKMLSEAVNNLSGVARDALSLANDAQRLQNPSTKANPSS